jgi:predicted transposase YbfD/YdcC
MEMTGTNGACLMSCLSELDDPRQPSNGTLHDFQEILVIAIAAMLSDSDTVEDIAYWARKKEAWLRRFLVLKNGIPSEETFLRIFRVLDPKQFETAFRRWVSGVVGALSGTLAVDGKTVRGSGSGGETAIHRVSAFATELGVVLGQEKVVAKSNEITAIPELLQALYLKGHRVTIDAMGCQKAIAAQIVAQKGDYLLAVKGNQPTLHAAIQKAFANLSGEQPWHEHSERSHGRRVTQFAWVAPAEGVVNTRDGSACKTIGCIVSQRVVANKVAEAEWRYYISSSELSAADLVLSTRAHWGIENRLHWVLDVSFGEEGSTLRKDNAPQNLSLLKKIVLNLIRLDTTDKTKASLRLKRKGAAWDDELRMNMLGLTPL